MKEALAGFPPIYLIPLALLSLANYILRYVKWHWYLKLLGHRIKRFPNFLVFLSGFALTVTPGKVGEFIKAFIVKERFQFAEDGGCTCPPRLPCGCKAERKAVRLSRGARKATAAEIARNPRAESVRFRAIERIETTVGVR